jgi:hypothetical protein
MARPIAQCGTNSGYLRHRRLREEPCDACRDAHYEYHTAYSRQRSHSPAGYKPRGRRERPYGVRPPCGTNAGAQWHWRHRERACDACLQAARDYRRTGVTAPTPEASQPERPPDRYLAKWSTEQQLDAMRERCRTQPDTDLLIDILGIGDH